MLTLPQYINENGKLLTENLVEITNYLVVVQHNTETGYCEPVAGVTAIDTRNNTITYMDFDDSAPGNLPKEKTRTGKIYLFVNKEVIANLEKLQSVPDQQTL